MTEEIRNEQIASPQGSRRNSNDDEAENGVQVARSNLDRIFDMIEKQQQAITQLQDKDNRANGSNKDDEIRTEGQGDGNDRGLETSESSVVMKLLQDLSSRMEQNEKKLNIFNSQVDQIPGVPQILKGPDSKKYVQLPFPPSAAPKLIPKRFKMTDLSKYDETMDPQEHVTEYTCAIKGNDMQRDEIESVMLKTFDAFIKAHAGAKKVQARKADIFIIAQKDDELLREFVTRFQKEQMLLLAVPDEWAAEAFTKGLNPRSSSASLKLKKNLLEYPTGTWADVHNRYESKIRVENDQSKLSAGTVGRVKGHKKSKRVADSDLKALKDRYQPYGALERLNCRSERRQNNLYFPSVRSSGDKGYGRRPSSRGLQDKNATGTSFANNVESPRLSEYNFNIDAAELVLAIGRMEGAKFPKGILTDSNLRDRRLICAYHQTQGHQTEDCRHLRDEIARLLKEGHLREFLSDRSKANYGKNKDTNKPVELVNRQHVINIFIGGIDVVETTIVASKKTKVSVNQDNRSRDCLRNEAITFNHEDAEDIAHPHNFALVISVKINKFLVKCILIDPGSSTNIIQWRVLEQMAILDQIVLAVRVLNGFNMANETTKREIIVPVDASRMARLTNFYVIDYVMRYKALFGRPWIHDMEDVPSTLHVTLKFPTPKGINDIRGDQPAAEEMFTIEGTLKKKKDTKNKEIFAK
ncbi:uncharacterized protein LOC132628685 [Lycium barbarum]|uniref:uncharacterized protein LOC132628685 n=1 Tax=Lycium barbarum TaxID=112863 RepID=UPI00293E2C8F|nr:uncharacterized protein LOC132628685 [Lycium barbarum]